MAAYALIYPRMIRSVKEAAFYAYQTHKLYFLKVLIMVLCMLAIRIIIVSCNVISYTDVRLL